MTVTPTIRIFRKLIECDLVIFDMTGTLIDTQARLRARVRSRARVLVGLVGEEAVVNWARLSGVSIGTWDTDEDGPLAKAPRREDLIVAASAIYLIGRRWEEARDLARKAYDEADRQLAASYEPTLFEGVEDALRRLKASGMRLAIATNDRRADAEETMRTMGALDIFEAVVGADEVEHPKPSPDMILMACERCQIQPSAAVCVGDQPTDMEAGKAAGVRAVVGIRRGPDPSPELSSLADFVLESVRSLRVV